MWLSTFNAFLFNKLKTPRVFLLVLIIFVAALLRFYALPSFPPGLYSDEAVNGVNALEALHNTNFSAEGGPAFGWKVFYPENFGREGLFINIQALSVWLFGPEAWALRLVSGIFGTLTVLGLYFLTKELLRRNEVVSAEETDLYCIPFTKILLKKNEAAALLAAFFLAVTFWHINFSRIGFRAIMAPFWGTWGLYYILLAYRQLFENRALNLKSRQLYYALLGGLVFGAGIHSYIAYRVMPALLLLLFIKLAWDARRVALLKNFLAATAVIAVAGILSALPLLLHFVSVPADFTGRTGAISVFNSGQPFYDLGLNIIKTLGMFNVAGDWNQRHNISGNPQLFWPVGIFFLIGLYVGARAVFGRLIEIMRRLPRTASSEAIFGAFEYFVLFAWLALAALPVVISNEGLPHALRAILMIPPVFILSAAGAVYLYKKTIGVICARATDQADSLCRRLNVAVLVFLILLVFEAYTSYFILWGNNPKTAAAFNKETTDFAYEIRALPKELKKYVIYNPNDYGVYVVWFLTNSYLPDDQKKRNIFYFHPGEVDENQMQNGIFVTQMR